MSFFGSIFGSADKKPQQSSRPPAPVKSTAPAPAPTDGGFFNLPTSATKSQTNEDKDPVPTQIKGAASGFTFVSSPPGMCLSSLRCPEMS